ncbi:hypothetical protein DL546_003812 [Coniochaeta pulveracea]|uniref:Protein rds1 n=1 Tax=Coniochaeta pulveracea TaxID=177199 RepID=A0A420XYV6_9PEZI|nr:hypothetical protein DL546_003812 [Coniochaeta pulveracea]
MAPSRTLLTGSSLMALLGSTVAVPFVSEPTTTVTSVPTFTPSAVADVHNVTSHGPYTGTPTTTGAIMTSIIAPSIPARPPGPDAFKYPADGQLHAPEPAPYTPSGGLGTNGSMPVYKVLTDFDFESLALAEYQEYLELDLFHWGLERFSVEDWEAEGFTAEDRFLIEHMGNQEIGHATVVANMLGPKAPKMCTYNYPVNTVAEFIDFCQKITRFGEAGVYGFLPHLNARDVAQILLQSITVEARQQMAFRQFEGLFPMPEWFETGIPQSWAWTFIAPYISSCPANQTRLIWQNFPALHILNQPNPARINGSSVWNETLGDPQNTLNSTGIPESELCRNKNVTGIDCSPAVTHNRSVPLSYPGRQVFLQWDEPGQAVGPNNSYVTSTMAGAPKFALWVSQLNATYTPLLNVSGNTAYTIQPNGTVFDNGAAVVNNTVFLAITDSDLYVTPHNMTMVNPHVRALGMYQSG